MLLAVAGTFAGMQTVVFLCLPQALAHDRAAALSKAQAQGDMLSEKVGSPRVIAMDARLSSCFPNVGSMHAQVRLLTDALRASEAEAAQQLEDASQQLMAAQVQLAVYQDAQPLALPTSDALHAGAALGSRPGEETLT